MAKSIRKEHKMPFVSHLLYSSVSLYGLVKIVLVYPTAYPCNDLTYNSKCVQRWKINCYSWQKLTVASIECDLPCDLPCVAPPADQPTSEA